MRIDNAQFTGSATGTTATATLSGSFSGSHEGSGLRLTQVTASKLLFSASFGLGIVNNFDFDGSTNQTVTLDTASAHFISGARAAGADTGSLLITASISGLTQSFTKGDGSTFEINLPDTSSATQTDTGSFIVSASLSSLTASGLFTMSFTNKKSEIINVNLSASDFASTASRTLGVLSNGQGVDNFTFEGSTTTTVGIGTFSASIDSKVNTNSSSIATTVNTVSSSLSASIADIIDGTTTIASASYAVTSSHAITASYFKGNAENVSINNSSITGSTISGSTIDGSTITNTTASSIQATGSFQGDLDGTASFASKVENTLDQGLGIENFSYDGDTAGLIVQLDTSSAHYLTTIGNYTQSLSTSITASINAATSSLSSSLTVTDQAISSSVAALSASASTSRIAQSSSAASALTAQSASNAINFVSQSIYNTQTGSFVTNATTQSGREEDTLEFTKGDGTTFNVTLTTSSFVKSVNTATPDAAGNVAVSITSVETGTSASMLAASSSGLLNEGDVWVVSGESGSSPISGSASNGKAYIFNSGSTPGSGELLPLYSIDQAENDARYVQKAGDTMTGNLILPAVNPTLANEATRKAYVDLFYDSSSIADASSQLSLHKGDGTVDIVPLAGISVSNSLSASNVGVADGRRITATTNPTQNFITLNDGASNAEIGSANNLELNINTDGGAIGQIDFQNNGTSVANIDQDGTGSFAWVDSTASYANRTRHSLTTASANAGVIGFEFDGSTAQTVAIDTGSAIFQAGASASVATIITNVSASQAATTNNLSGSLATLSGSFETVSGSVGPGGSQTNVNITGSTISGSAISGSTISGSTFNGGDFTGDITLSGVLAGGTANLSGSFTGSLSGSAIEARTYDPQVETANFNFIQGHLHVVSTAITGTLPASPTPGDRVAFMNLSTVEPLIARNGSNIMASATDMTIDSQYASFQLIYTAATEGWILVGANN